MINKKTAHDNGIKIIDSKNLLSDKDNDLIEKLKKLLPQVINVDNQIDTKALNDIVDISATTANNQGYELTFAGKGLAKAAASAPTIKELKTISTQSKDYDNTENVVIRGDNLDVLKILSANYFNQIKMIYIDPPYNTKSENFIYKDNFKKSDNDLIENFAMDEDQIDFLQNVYGTRSHSGWLSFMYPRLKLARDLLKDDGVIFVSIDDNEQANLKIMCDEIFGEDNFVTSFIWEKKKKPAFLHKNVGKLAEYILCYTKNNNNSFAFSVEETEAGKRTPINNAGNTKAILTFPKGSVNFDLKDQTIVAQNMSDGNIITKLMEDVIIENGTNKNDLILDGEWRYSQQTINEIVSNGDKIIISKIPFRPNRIKQGGEIKKMKNMLSQHHYQMNTNEDATNYLSKLLGSENIFDNSKPYQLVETFIKAITYHDKSSIILDFFAGSGTTGDAVMRLNAEDGGARKFILVQLDEKIDNKKSSEAYKFCVDNKLDPVISSITIERLNRAGDKIKQDFKTNKKDMFADKKLPDIGYKVFSATDKPQVSDDKAIKGFAIKNHRQSTADTLINMLVATCKNLTCSIQCIIKDKLYMADNEIYLLKNITTEKLEPYQNQKINLDGWADIDLQNYLNLQVNIKENIYIIY